MDRLTSPTDTGPMTLRILTIVTAVGSAVSAGIFFTFSTFTMAGLRQLPANQGAAAMQAINREAPSGLFGVLLIVTTLGCVALGVSSVLRLHEPAARYQLAACVLYLVGVVVVTGAYHVPRNDVLAGLDANSPEGTSYWATYVVEWVRMNHVRTIAPLVASILLILSL
jgi:uncharacterized membrane protein